MIHVRPPLRMALLEGDVARGPTASEIPTTQAASSPRRRRRVRPLLVTALLVLAAELAVRAAELPAPLEWSSVEAQVKVEDLEALGPGGVHTLFVGSSVVDVALRPDRFTASTGETAYNAALLGADLRSIDLWVRDVLVPTVHPQRVVLGLSCRELNGGEAAQDDIFRSFVAAPAMQRRLGTDSWLDRVGRFVGEWSELVRYRSVLRLPADAAGRDRRVGVNLDLVGDGFNEAYTTRAYPAPGAVHDVLYRGDVSTYAVGEDRLAALDRTLARLADAGIEAVVLHMPTSEDWLGYLPPGGMADCESAMAEHAATGGARFLDGGVLGRELFADPIHVNGTGADRVTDMLVEAIGSGAGT